MTITRANMVRVFYGESGGRQYSEGAQQNHRHRDGGDEGGADVLQEQEHDDKHQKDRLQQGLHHLFDGYLDKRGCIVG